MWWQAVGKTSLRAIAAGLNEAGIPTARGLSMLKACGQSIPSARPVYVTDIT